MAIDKNFVVKNGLEVSDNLIHADAVTKRIGIGTDQPEYLLDVKAIPKPGEVIVGIATTTVAIFRGDVIIQGTLDVANDEINLDYGDITNIIGENLSYNIGTITNFNSTRAGINTLTVQNINAGPGIASLPLVVSGIATVDLGIGNTLRYQTGFITSIIGSNLNYNIGTITNLSGTISTITTSTGTNLEYTNAYVGNLYAQSGIVTTLNSTNATLTNVAGNTLGYNTGTITTFTSSDGTITNLTGTAVTYSEANFTNVVGVSVTATDFSGAKATINVLDGQQLNYAIGTFRNALYLDSALYDDNRTYGNYGQYLKSLGGTGGADGGPAVQWESFGVLRNREVFTAGAGQTEFAFQYDLSTLGDPPGIGLGVNPEALYLDVYLNGVKLIQGDDYIATSGVGITLTTPADLGDIIEMNALIDNDLILIDGATITVSNFGQNAGIASFIDFTDNMFVIGAGGPGIVTVGVALSGLYVIDVAGISSFTEQVLINQVSTANTFYAINLTNLTGGIGTYKDTFVDADLAGLVYYPLGSKLGVGVSVLEDYNITAAVDAKIGNIALETNTLTGEAKISPTQSVVSLGTTDRITIGSSLAVETDITAEGSVTAEEYYGDGVNLVGIVTQVVAGIGVNIFGSQPQGKGVVKIDAYRPVGKTIYVSQTGDDNNTGLAENYPKRTIKAAAGAALFGDTIKVFPGVYVEENPILLKKTVSVEGTELRNCVVTPKYPNQDLFFVNNGCHLTDLSFIGPQMTNGAAIVSFERLLGVSTGRYFDAARLIRLNLDYIAKESVGFLTSGFSGFAGTHREQDAGRLLDLNLDFIAEETVAWLYTPNANPSLGYLGSAGLALTTTGLTGSPPPVPATVKQSCKDDIKDIIRSISNDLKANSNRNSVGAGKSYYDPVGNLLHINGQDGNGNLIREATVAAINHAVGIATYIINNIDYKAQPGIVSFTSASQNFSYSPIIVPGGCPETITKINGLRDNIVNIINDYGSLSGITTIYGVNIDSSLCAKDVKNIWKAVCFDITRGGNFKSVGAGKSYYDEDWNLKTGILKNPEEVAQTIATLDYSFKVARSIVNNCTWGGYPVGVGTSVSNAVYDHVTGITTITTNGPHGLVKDDPARIVGLAFTCNYDGGATSVVFPRDGDYGVIFPVQSVIGPNTFTFVGGASTTPHYYTTGGTVQKYQNFQQEFTQVKDLGIQPDPETGFNNTVNSCANVISAMHSCIGVVTSIVGLGSTAFSTVGFNTTYPGNSGYGFNSVTSVIGATYDNSSGIATITAPGILVKKGDLIEIRDLEFSCPYDPSNVLKFPSGYYGYDFNIDKINPDGSFAINVGVSTIPHNYEGGGFIVKRSVGVTTASYNNVTGITTITAAGAVIKKGDLVVLRDLEFSCPSGAGTTTLYPTGNNGFTFEVLNVIGGDSDGSNTFVVNVGPSTIPHTYQSGGVIFPPFSKGVGNILQGPYVRNCTNFIPGSIGMLVDGVNAEPGDDDDVGVTGAMSVDSYTQYNQGGIGVSITNGSYCQLVSIFTICDDIAIYTGTGGQCDITNSNSSFGRLGLVSVGVGDNTSKSIYRYTGNIILNNDGNEPAAEQAEITVSGIGSYRPYDGQALYFGELFYTVQRVEVINGGSGYVDDDPPTVTFGDPEGENGITAEALVTVEGGKVIAVDLVSTGTQYRNPPSIHFTGGPGITTASAQATMAPIYYTIESATLPRAGISTIILNTNLNNNVSVGTTVYFSRLSLQIASSHSFEWVGAGNEILKAKPGLGGVVIQENEIVKIDGGEIVYTSTDQAGNFKIGDGVTVNQLTGTVSGRAFNQSLLNTVTPLIIALGR
jgi:hypothetical protein